MTSRNTANILGWLPSRPKKHPRPAPKVYLRFEGRILTVPEVYFRFNKVDFLEVPAGALEILRRCYRLVHVVEILDNDRCTVKCTQGSSAFTTAEMKNLIDGIFDRLAEMGVNDPMVTAYWQEWKEP